MNPTQGHRLHSRREPETLDPNDWEELRALAHRVVDDVVNYHKTVAQRAVWKPVPPDVRERLALDIPDEGVGEEGAYAAVMRDVMPYPFGNIHPRAWGWVNGTGSTFGTLADMIGSAMNPNCWGGDQAATYVENAVLDWARKAMDFPPESTGLLVSGGSVANLIALAAAREAHGGSRISTHGLHAAAEQLVVYCSEQTHNSVDKAVALLGIGFDNLRKVATNSDFQIDTRQLEQMIVADKTAGLRPFCIVGNAGTVNSGAIDDLTELAALARRQHLWFHIDGAFGALAALSGELKPRLKGLEHGDSVAFDLHKWLYAPIEVGCVLIRDAAAHRATFSPPASYLAKFDRGVTAGPVNFSMLGPQLTRSFRALKVWMTLQAYGTSKFARLIEQDVRHAQYLADLVEQHSRLELVASVPLNVVCFRYTNGTANDELNRINTELLMRLQESGVAVPSSTVLNGSFALRAAFTNHRTRESDLDTLVRAVAEMGDEITA